jgi:hypothetical protein
MKLLRIQNYTAYRTLDLRRFFAAGLRAMGATQPKTIEVRYLSGNLRRCMASVGTFKEMRNTDPDGEVAKKWQLTEGRWIRMLIARPPVLGHDGNGKPVELMHLGAGSVALEPVRRFARVFEHEVLHNKGVRHREMTPSQRNCDEPLPKWAEGLVIRLKEPKAKRSAADKVAEREQHAREMLAAYERKQKRVATLLKKWKAKVRYYERRAAAKRTP